MKSAKKGRARVPEVAEKLGVVHEREGHELAVGSVQTALPDKAEDGTEQYTPARFGYLRVGRDSRPVPYNCSCVMPVTLDSILARTRHCLSQRRQSIDLRALEQAAERHTPRGFRKSIQRVSQDGIAVIAELKKASPSKGLIRADFDPAALARELEQAGAAALSVLTDEQFFQGSLGYLRQASAATSLPCLRKDFIVDELQIVEARANCADAVLLIVAALNQKELLALSHCARAHHLDVLCEAHDEQELKRAIDAGCDLIGINNRDLRTFEVKLETALQLADKIPAGCLRIAESGIHNSADIASLRAAGYKAFLIGESLMKASKPGEALTKLLEESTQEVAASKQEGFSSRQVGSSSRLEARSSKLSL
ncbi:MAG: indole-3-glycerol phosphate synthase TrpC [Terriglobales bacterium]